MLVVTVALLKGFPLVPVTKPMSRAPVTAAAPRTGVPKWRTLRGRLHERNGLTNLDSDESYQNVFTQCFRLADTHEGVKALRVGSRSPTTVLPSCAPQSARSIWPAPVRSDRASVDPDRRVQRLLDGTTRNSIGPARRDFHHWIVSHLTLTYERLRSLEKAASGSTTTRPRRARRQAMCPSPQCSRSTDAAWKTDQGVVGNRHRPQRGGHR